MERFCRKKIFLQKAKLAEERKACWRKSAEGRFFVETFFWRKILQQDDVSTSHIQGLFCRNSPGKYIFLQQILLQKIFLMISLQKIFLMISLQKIFLWTAQTERRLLTPWYNSCDFVTYGAGFVQPKTMALLVWCIWPKYFYLATKNIVCRQDLSRQESNTIHRLQLATFKTMLIVFRNLLSPSSILNRTDKISTS